MRSVGGQLLDGADAWLRQYLELAFQAPDGTRAAGKDILVSAEAQRALLRQFEDVQGRLQARRPEIEKREVERLEAEIAAHALPPRRVVDIIRRYDGPNIRQLYRSLRQLRELQKERHRRERGKKASPETRAPKIDN